VDKRLWPGQTLSIGSEATAARGKLKGETMRFVIEANGREFPTGPYMIFEWCFNRLILAESRQLGRNVNAPIATLTSGAFTKRVYILGGAS